MKFCVLTKFTHGYETSYCESCFNKIYNKRYNEKIK